MQSSNTQAQPPMRPTIQHRRHFRHVAMRDTALPRNVLEALAIETLVHRVQTTQPAVRGPQGVWYPQDFEAFVHALGERLPPNMWTGHAPSAHLHKSAPHSFVLKPGKSASEAISSFFAGPTITECGSVLAAALWHSIRTILGREKLDAIFGNVDNAPNAQPLQIASTTALTNPLAYFVDWCPPMRQGAFDIAHAQRGDVFYIQGVPHYQAKHPDGTSRGTNVIYLGPSPNNEPLFTGFGLPQEASEAGIRRLLIADYNAPRSARAQAYIRHSAHPKAYDLQAEGLPATLPSDDATHAVGLIPNTQRRLRLDRLREAHVTPSAQLAVTVARWLAAQQPGNDKAASNG